jgi:hypothetical protein
MIGSSLRRPSARITPIGNERRMPTVASSTVSRRPPHTFVLIEGKGVPSMPLRSRNVAGSDSSQPIISARDGTWTRRPAMNATHTITAFASIAAAGTIPSGERTMSAASMSWMTESVTASVRVACPKAAADSPPSTDRISRFAQIRHAWSAGYCPMRNRRRLFVTTLQRASVSAQVPTWSRTQPSARPMTMVSTLLIGPEKRLARSQA